MVANEMRVRDVAILCATNVTSCIQKPKHGGRFEMKQRMVKIFHSNWMFIGVSHDDPMVHIQNILEISYAYTPTRLNIDYVNLTLFHFSLLVEEKR